jgi:hypothetical protein
MKQMEQIICLHLLQHVMLGSSEQQITQGSTSVAETLVTFRLLMCLRMNVFLRHMALLEKLVMISQNLIRFIGMFIFLLASR